METKTVYAIITYTGEVPEDMTPAQIEEALREKFTYASDSGFRISVTDYEGQEERDLEFRCEDVDACEAFQLIIDRPGGPGFILRNS